MCLCENCAPVCLIQSQLQSPALQDASPTLQSTKMEHSKQQRTIGHTQTYPHPTLLPFISESNNSVMR